MSNPAEDFPADFDPKALLASIKKMAEEAGEILIKHYGQLAGHDVDFKGRRDLVTVADRAAEDRITSRIREFFPRHGILAEESSHERPAGWDEGFCWVIDPLDGTTNFVHQIPMFCVSIGLLWNGRPFAGAIFAPRLQEMFLACRGQGATLNGQKISVSPTDRMIDAMLATGFAYKVDELADNNLDHFCELIPKTRAIRRCGSAAIDLAYTACGRFDGFWELHLAPWDVVAGAILVTEAGGVVTDLSGGEDYIFGKAILAANRPMQSLLMAALTAEIESRE